MAHLHEFGFKQNVVENSSLILNVKIKEMHKILLLYTYYIPFRKF